MYNAKYIIPGLVVFVALFTAPFWYNLLVGTSYAELDLALPENAQEIGCIEDVAFMRAEHMQILDTWRDSALREGKRTYVATDGTEYSISLQNTCMNCHANKEEFCDKCHATNSVDPYCWDCHLAPGGNE